MIAAASLLLVAIQGGGTSPTASSIEAAVIVETDRANDNFMVDDTFFVYVLVEENLVEENTYRIRIIKIR